MRASRPYLSVSSSETFFRSRRPGISDDDGGGGGGSSVSGRRHDNVFPQRTRPGL